MKAVIIVLSSIFIMSVQVQAQDNYNNLGTTDAFEDDAPTWSVAARASTQGAGLEIGYRLSDHFGARLGGYYLKGSADKSADGIQYDFDVKLLSGGAYLDYHPWAGGFRVSAGVLYNDNTVDALAKSDQNLNIGNLTYTPDEIGQLTGDITTNKIMPYLGIGYGSMISNTGFTFSIDLGVAYHGTPKTTLNALIPDDSPLNLDPARRAQFDADLQLEIDEFNDNIDKYKFYPVLNIGAAYRF